MLHAFVGAGVYCLFPSADGLPLWNSKGLLYALLVHMTLSETLFYFSHRLFHHSGFLYLRYHSLHHSVTVPQSHTGDELSTSTTATCFILPLIHLAVELSSQHLTILLSIYLSISLHLYHIVYLSAPVSLYAFLCACITLSLFLTLVEWCSRACHADGASGLGGSHGDASLG